MDNGCGPNPLGSNSSSAKRLSLRTGRFTRKTQMTSAQELAVRLRMKACYTSLTVLPVWAYSTLQSQLLSSCEGRDENQSVALLRSLEPFLGVKSKATLSQSLLAMHRIRRHVPEFLSTLVLSEVREQGNVSI